jgi:hypothetical protein
MDLWSVNDQRTIEGLEAQIRGLNRRLSEVDAALSDTQEILRAEPDNFAIALSNSSLSKMQASLQNELVEAVRYRRNEEIKIVLDGRNVRDHSTDVLSLSVILSRFQRLYSSIAHAIHNGPTMRGPLASGILKSTSLRLQATYPSSFGMKIYVPSDFDLLGNSVSVSALEVLFELFGSSTRDDYVMEKAGEIGSRSMRHLRALARHIEESGTELSVDWRDYSGIKHDWQIDAEKASVVVGAIDRIATTRSELREVKGRLVGASLLRDRFELLSGDTLFSGKFVASQTQLVQEVFGQEVSVILEETEVTDLASNEKRSYFTLTEIQKED